MGKTRPANMEERKNAQAEADTIEAPAAKAVRSLGTSAFPAAFAGVAGKVFQADQVIVFKSDGTGRIKTLLAQNARDGTDRAHNLAESYRGRHWAKDPNRPLLLPMDGTGQDLVLRATRVDDIEDRAYRQSLFVEPRLGGKASLVVRRPDHALYLNLYRGADRKPFADEEIESVRQSGDLLIALLEQHFALAEDDAAYDLNAVQRLIVRVADERGVPLSAREAAVCARMVAGFSTEGVALDLGVSQHTAISYRRRAFEKLGIATQRELFSIVLRKHRLLGR